MSTSPSQKLPVVPTTFFGGDGSFQTSFNFTGTSNTQDLPDTKRRTTQSIKVEFPKDVYLGTGDYTIHIPKLGDLITRVRVICNFGGNTLRESIINKAEFIVNSNVLESLKGDFIKIDNEFKTPLEKVATSNVLVNTTINLPFYIVKKGFFMVSEPDIRISFGGNPGYKISSGYLLVDYTLIENPPKTTFFQRVRQVQDISVIGSPGCNNIKVDTAFNGPVYQIYFTVENLNTGTLVPNITNVALYSGANFERFNLSGNYLLYTEPMKRYKGLPNEPVYLYSFALDPSHDAPSGQMNFSRLDSQRFEIQLAPIVDPVKVTIWAQSHNFVFFNSSNCLPIFQSGEYTLSNTQNTITIPSLPIKLNNEVINTYAKVNISGATSIPISNTLALTQTLGTIDNRLTNLVLSSPGYSNITCNVYQTSVNSLFLNFSSSATIVKAVCDPQLNTIIMLMSDGSLIDQRKGTFTPSLSGTPFDMVLDLYANPIVSTSTQVVTLNRGTYTIKSSVTLGAPAALYFDNSSVWASYYSSPNCVVRNLTTGSTVSKNFGLGTLSAAKFCNSSNYVQFLSSTQTYVLQFSTGTVFTGYFYQDGIISEQTSQAVSFNTPWATDSFTNIYFIDISANTTFLSYDTFGKNKQQTFNVDNYNKPFLLFFNDPLSITNNISPTGIFENKETHTLVVYGKNTYSDSFTVTDSTFTKYSISANSNFIFSVDFNGKILQNSSLSLTNLENYNPQLTYFDPSVFSGPLNPIRYPPASMSSNVVTFTGYQYGSGTYTISSTVPSQTNNLIKGFNCAPSWTGGSSDYILIKAPSGISVNGVFIGGAVSGTVTVNIVSADFISLYPIASGTLTNNILQFSKTYTTHYIWQVIASGTLNDIALLYIV